jgi:hypothetical protein
MKELKIAKKPLDYDFVATKSKKKTWKIKKNIKG